MADYVASKHDIGFLRTDGSTQVGLRLAKDKKGDPIYRTYDDEYLAQQIYTGAPGYSNLPPEKEITLVRDDWRSGFGETVFDSTDPKRYFSSTGMDMRHKGMGILSWGLSALTKPTAVAPTITDPGFANWSGGDLVSWLKEAGSQTEDTTTYRTTPSLEISANGITYQDLATTQIKGRRFTATVYCHPTSTSTCRIGLNDGFTTTWSAYNLGTGAWELVTATKTLSQSATRLRIYIHTFNEANEFDDVAITRATFGATTCHADFGDNLFMNMGGLLTKLSATTLAGVYEFPATITSLEVGNDGFLYIGLESTQIIEDCEDAWTAGANTTVTLDATDYKVGSGSAKIVYDGSGANGDIIAYENFAAASALDLQHFTGISLWIKADVAVAAADLAIVLATAAGGIGAEEVIQMPALTAGVWTRVYTRIADATDLMGIISVGLEYNANEKTNTIHLDDIKAESSYYYMDTGETLTQSTLNVAKYDSFAKFFALNNVTMWKSLPPNRIYSSTDPSNAAAANWSAATVVDSAANEITALLSQKNSVYITKEDRPFYLTAAGAVTVLTEETRHIASSTGGKNSISWRGGLYMPYGGASLLEFDSDSAFNWIDPSLYCNDLPAFDGQIQAVAGDDQWLYIIVDNGGSVEIIAGRLETVNGITSWAWHPYKSQTLTGCEYAFVSSKTQKRLYISSTDSSENIYYLPLPATYGNIASDANKAFSTGGYFETPWHHLNFKGDSKGFIRVILTMGSTSSTVYYTVEYQLRGSANWTEINATAKFKTSPVTVGYIPVDDASAANPVSTMIRFRITGVTGSMASTPILYSYDIRAILYPTNRQITECEIICDDKIVLKDGKIETGQAATIKEALEEARNATWPVTFYELGGGTIYVKFLPLQMKVTKAEKGRGFERHYLLRLQEVALS